MKIQVVAGLKMKIQEPTSIANEITNE